MTKHVTYHVTEKAEVLFMAAARPTQNYKKTKEEYVIKIKLPDDSPTIKHISEINRAMVDTDANRLLEREGYKEKHVSFKSDFAPRVIDSQGNTLTEGDIPFFDGRVDKATVQVIYVVIDYLNAKIVRLKGIKILSLEQAPREEQKPMDQILDEIKEFLQ